MTPGTIEAITAVASVAISVGASVFIAGRKVGRNDSDIAELKTRTAKAEELAGDVKMLMRDVAEIKGMFRLELRKDARDE